MLPYPDELVASLAALGRRLRAARQQRGLRRIDVSERCGLSRSTVEAVERGEPGTAIGAYLRLLWLYGLHRELDLLADPALDREGAALAFDPRARRVRIARAPDDDF